MAAILGMLLLLPFGPQHSVLAAPKPGTVVFGSSFSVSHGLFRVHNAHSAFRPGDRMAWVAYFSQPVNSTHLMMFVLKKLSGGAIEDTFNYTYTVGDPNMGQVGKSFAHASVLQAVGISAPGTYILRYARDTTTLAQGTFTLKR